MGYSFGFKLHLAVDDRGDLAGWHISKGNHHDRRHAAKLVRRRTKTLVGDSHSGGKPLLAELQAKGVRVVSNTNKDPSNRARYPAEAPISSRVSVCHPQGQTLTGQ